MTFCAASLCSPGRFRIGFHFDRRLLFHSWVLFQHELSHVDSDEMGVHIHPCVRRFSFLPRFRRKKEFIKSAAYGVRHLGAIRHALYLPQKRPIVRNMPMGQKKLGLIAAGAESHTCVLVSSR